MTISWDQCSVEEVSSHLFPDPQQEQPMGVKEHHLKSHSSTVVLLFTSSLSSTLSELCYYFLGVQLSKAKSITKEFSFFSAKTRVKWDYFADTAGCNNSPLFLPKVATSKPMIDLLCLSLHLSEWKLPKTLPSRLPFVDVAHKLCTPCPQMQLLFGKYTDSFLPYTIRSQESNKEIDDSKLVETNDSIPKVELAMETSSRLQFSWRKCRIG